MNEKNFIKNPIIGGNPAKLKNIIKTLKYQKLFFWHIYLNSRIFFIIGSFSVTENNEFIIILKIWIMKKI